MFFKYYIVISLSGNNTHKNLKKKKKKCEGGKYTELDHKNVDTGFGLDRLLVFLNGLSDGYKTDLFDEAIKYLEAASGKS